MAAKAQPSWWSPNVVTMEEKGGRAEDEVMVDSPCTRRRRLGGWNFEESIEWLAWVGNEILLGRV